MMVLFTKTTHTHEYIALVPVQCLLWGGSVHARPWKGGEATGTAEANQGPSLPVQLHRGPHARMVWDHPANGRHSGQRGGRWDAPVIKHWISLFIENCVHDRVKIYYYDSLQHWLSFKYTEYSNIRLTSCMYACSDSVLAPLTQDLSSLQYCP